jgi:hypothetical protein
LLSAQPHSVTAVAFSRQFYRPTTVRAVRPHFAVAGPA